MKEASGELNMTVITIVAIAAVGLLFYIFVWPMIQQSIVTQSCKTYGSNYKAVRGPKVSEGSNANVYDWYCCSGNTTSITNANSIPADCIGKQN